MLVNRDDRDGEIERFDIVIIGKDESRKTIEEIVSFECIEDTGLVKIYLDYDRNDPKNIVTLVDIESITIIG